MLLLTRILGHRDDRAWQGRAIETVAVGWEDAAKRRLRRTTDAGTDVAIDLPRGTFLADGAVLHASDERVIAVRRPPAPAVLVRFRADAPHAELVRDALALGLALGNQHAPADVQGAALAIPILTSEAVLLAQLERLGLTSADVAPADVALFRRGPGAGAAGGHGHGEGGHRHGADAHGHGAGR